MKVRDAIRIIERDGWSLVNQEGSHRQYKHPAKKGRVTIAGHPSMDLQAGLK
jgi:predicted RNA binding protein YcfA (HicA-like mRNA interferase family)